MPWVPILFVVHDTISTLQTVDHIITSEVRTMQDAGLIISSIMCGLPSTYGEQQEDHGWSMFWRCVKFRKNKIWQSFGETDLAKKKKNDLADLRYGTIGYDTGHPFGFSRKFCPAIFLLPPNSQRYYPVLPLVFPLFFPSPTSTSLTLSMIRTPRVTF